MKLDGKEKKEFREVLMKSFSDEPNLKMMVSDQLNERLNKIASGDTQEKLVFNLIDWAEEQGRLGDLLIGALKQNHSNVELNSFFRKNINKLLVCEDPIIKFSLCEQLIPVFEKFRNINLIYSCVFQSLPDGFQDNSEQDCQDLKDSNIPLIIKVFLIFKLLIILYPKTNSHPSLLIFAQKLVGEIEDRQIQQELRDWIGKVVKEYHLDIPNITPVVPTNDPLEAYLIITVAPANELNKFCLNAYLELPKIPIIPIDLPEEQFQKGVIVSLKKTPDGNAPQAIIYFIQESENLLRIKQKELGYKNYNLTIEFFLPLQYLHEDIENFKIMKLQNWFPMGALYKIVVRSYERVRDVGLWNELQVCWSKIQTILRGNNSQPSNYIACFQTGCDWKDLPSLLRNKIALTLPGSLPNSEKIRQNLFREIIFKGIPIAIWTRCNKLSEVDIVAELENLLSLDCFINPDFLLNTIKEKRDEVKFQQEPQQFLGYHLGIMYESNRWEEIPLLEDIPLSD
jgi:hypothetical protein